MLLGVDEIFASTVENRHWYPNRCPKNSWENGCTCPSSSCSLLAHCGRVHNHGLYKSALFLISKLSRLSWKSLCLISPMCSWSNCLYFPCCVWFLLICTLSTSFWWILAPYKYSLLLLLWLGPSPGTSQNTTLSWDQSPQSLILYQLHFILPWKYGHSSRPDRKTIWKNIPGGSRQWISGWLNFLGPFFFNREIKDLRPDHAIIIKVWYYNIPPQSAGPNIMALTAEFCAYDNGSPLTC